MVYVVMKYRLLILTWMLLIAFTLADADDLPLEFSSGTQDVPLVELYTSEGCSQLPARRSLVEQTLRTRQCR